MTYVIFFRNNQKSTASTYCGVGIKVEIQISDTFTENPEDTFMYGQPFFFFKAQEPTLFNGGKRASSKMMLEYLDKYIKYIPQH